MTVFLRLLLAHMFSDFVFFRASTEKLKRERPVLGHALHLSVYMVCVIVFCRPYMGLPWLTLGGFAFNGWALLPALLAVHMVVDLMDHTDVSAAGRFHTISFLLWQIAAVLVLFLVFPYVPPQAEGSFAECFDKFLIIAAGALFATYFIMMLLYFIQRDLMGADFPLVDEQFFNILYRVVLYFLMLVPGVACWPLAAGWIALAAFIRKMARTDEPPLRIYFATLLTVAVALAVKAATAYA
ncbi:MAG: DUF3307 domain-containing protein [Elusimicrobiota bacterium]|jgi:hypothetical protein|nr:DUF3307 domain-containing protein [Elusimicrobiota bacterium]